MTTKVPVELVSLDGGVVINESSADVDFRVESNGNADMLFVDGGNDNVLLGTQNQGHIRLNQQLGLAVTGNVYGGISMATHSSSAGGNRSLLDFNRSRNTTIGSHTVVQSGDSLGTIVGRGDDGDEFLDAASIDFEVDGTPGNGDMPGRIVFATTADGASSVSERMRIDSSGHVGIGTTSPDDKLDIMGGGYDQIRIGSNKTDNTNKTAGIVSTTYTNNSVSFMQGFFQNGDNAVYYGSADSAHRGLQNHYFYVNSDSTATSGHTLALNIKSDASTCLPATKKLYFDGGSDTYMSEYSANELEIQTGGARRFALSGGNAFFSGTVTQNHNFSDLRLKENIASIPNALDKVSSLQGITFTRKSDGSVGTGLIAQELEKVLPEAVYEAKAVDSLDNPDAEKYKAIQYETTVGLLVEAIKELQARIATLEG